jgi:hypothetical protein
MSYEFTPWPKTARLFKDIVVTEKIDGTNAAIHINDEGTEVAAQSRKRLITPEDDNFGFARWVHNNAGALADTLGPGLHFGEWWGRGIQRNYGLDDRRFSLFNTSLAINDQVGDVEIRTVPIMYEGQFSEWAIRDSLKSLQADGSIAAPGFMNPEGVCVFHTASRTVYKVTIDKNDAGKWEL